MIDFLFQGSRPFILSQYRLRNVESQSCNLNKQRPCILIAVRKGAKPISKISNLISYRAGNIHSQGRNSLVQQLNSATNNQQSSDADNLREPMSCAGING